MGDGDYYLATYTFEYLPGIPVYHSTDLVTWTQVGNVGVRDEQLGVGDVPTNLGVWAPTIRHRDTAIDHAGPWSDGVVIELEGHRPGSHRGRRQHGLRHPLRSGAQSASVGRD